TSATSTRSSEAHTPVRRAHNVATDRSRRAEDVLLVGVYRRHVHRADVQRWSDVGAGLCCDVGTCRACGATEGTRTRRYRSAAEEPSDSSADRPGGGPE